ncbi:hypothetical protein Agub_g9539 [Astrephomene gubernaculifera]|uniref:Uncharacterized protein n=1 Tax=Astrephomene gubernaculifera TaxID=47775 RepID=A0AAD3DTM7_9CHLO|nr:hypothetical protein Agub_g9539 [Astrephomene gubernaculifera]
MADEVPEGSFAPWPKNAAGQGAAEGNAKTHLSSQSIDGGDMDDFIEGDIGNDPNVDMAFSDIGDLIGELQSMLSGSAQRAPPRPIEVVPVGGARWREVQSRRSLEMTSAQEVAELQSALAVSSGALRASQQQLQALSGRVEELQGQLEVECGRMHELHEQAVKVLQDRIRSQQAAADAAAAAAAAREAALGEQLRSATASAEEWRMLAERAAAASAAAAVATPPFSSAAAVAASAEAAELRRSVRAAQAEAQAQSAANACLRAALAEAQVQTTAMAATNRANTALIGQLQAQLAAQEVLLASAVATSEKLAVGASCSRVFRAVLEAAAEEDVRKAVAAVAAAERREEELAVKALCARVFRAVERAAAATTDAATAAANGRLLLEAEARAAASQSLLRAAEERWELERAGLASQLADLQTAAEAQQATHAVALVSLEQEQAALRQQMAAALEQVDRALADAAAAEQRSRVCSSEAAVALTEAAAQVHAAVATAEAAEQHRSSCAAAATAALADAAAGWQASLRAEAVLRQQVFDLAERLGQTRSRMRAEAERALQTLRAERAMEQSRRSALEAALAEEAAKALCCRIFRTVERSVAEEALAAAYEREAELAAKAVSARVLRAVERSALQAEASRSYEDLTARVSAGEEAVRQLEKMLEASQAACMVVESQRAAAEVRIAELGREVEDLGAQLAASEAAASQLRSQLAVVMESGLQQAELQSAKATADCADMQEQLSLSRSVHEQLHARLVGLEVEMQSMAEKVAAADAVVAAAAEAAAADVAALREDLESQRVSYAAQGITLRALRGAERSALLRELQAERCAHAETRMRLSAMLAAHGRMSGEVEALRVAHAELAAEVEHSRRTAERLWHQNAQLRGEQAAVTAELHAESDARLDAEARLAASVMELQAAREARDAERAASKAGCAAAAAGLEAAVQAVEGAERRAAEVRLAAAVAEEQAAGAVARAALEAQITDLQRAREADEQRGRERAALRATLTSQLMELRAAGEVQRAEHAAALAALERLRGEVDGAQQERQRLQQQLAAVQAQAAAVQRAAQGLNGALRSSQAELQEQRQQAVLAQAEAAAARQQLAEMVEAQQVVVRPEAVTAAAARAHEAVRRRGEQGGGAGAFATAAAAFAAAAAVENQVADARELRSLAACSGLGRSFSTVELPSPAVLAVPAMDVHQLALLQSRGSWRAWAVAQMQLAFMRSGGASEVVTQHQPQPAPQVQPLVVARSPMPAPSISVVDSASTSASAAAEGEHTETEAEVHALVGRVFARVLASQHGTTDTAALDAMALGTAAAVETEPCAASASPIIAVADALCELQAGLEKLRHAMATAQLTAAAPTVEEEEDEAGEEAGRVLEPQSVPHSAAVRQAPHDSFSAGVLRHLEALGRDFLALTGGLEGPDAAGGPDASGAGDAAGAHGSKGALTAALDSDGLLISSTSAEVVADAALLLPGRLEAAAATITPRRQAQGSQAGSPLPFIGTPELQDAATAGRRRQQQQQPSPAAVAAASVRVRSEGGAGSPGSSSSNGLASRHRGGSAGGGYASRGVCTAARTLTASHMAAQAEADRRRHLGLRAASDAGGRMVQPRTTMPATPEAEEVVGAGCGTGMTNCATTDMGEETASAMEAVWGQQSAAMPDMVADGNEVTHGSASQQGQDPQQQQYYPEGYHPQQQLLQRGSSGAASAAEMRMFDNPMFITHEEEGHEKEHARPLLEARSSGCEGIPDAVSDVMSEASVSSVAAGGGGGRRATTSSLPEAPSGGLQAAAGQRESLGTPSRSRGSNIPRLYDDRGQRQQSIRAVGGTAAFAGPARWGGSSGSPSSNGGTPIRSSGGGAWVVGRGGGGGSASSSGGSGVGQLEQQATGSPGQKGNSAVAKQYKNTGRKLNNKE